MVTRARSRLSLLASLALGLSLGLALLAPSGARAQDQDARHHFRLGQAHYESGHFAEAGHEFEESFRLSGRVELLHNVYVAYRDAGDLVRSADALRRYLASDAQIESRTVLEQRLASLDRLIAERGGAAAISAPDPAATAAVEAGEEPAASADVPATEGGASVATTDVPSASGDGGGLSPVGFIVGGIGAAALIAGAVTGGVALGNESALAEECGDDGVCPEGVDFESRASTGEALAITTDVLIPVGVAALAAGVVLILVLREGGSDDVAVGGACAPDGCVGYVGGVF